MALVDLGSEPVGSDRAGSVAVEAEGSGDRCAEQGITERGEDEPEGGFANVMRLMAAGAKLGDEAPQSLEDRIERVAVAGEDHPGGERSRSLAVEGIERAVDDLAGVGLVQPSPLDGIGDAGCNALGDGPDELRLQAGCRSEMVEQIGMRPPDLRRHRFQRDRLRALFKEQAARGFERGGPALFGVKAFAAY